VDCKAGGAAGQGVENFRKEGEKTCRYVNTVAKRYRVRAFGAARSGSDCSTVTSVATPRTCVMTIPVYSRAKKKPVRVPPRTSREQNNKFNTAIIAD
jgi:hypothetical protein